MPRDEIEKPRDQEKNGDVPSITGGGKIRHPQVLRDEVEKTTLNHSEKKR